MTHSYIPPNQPYTPAHVYTHDFRNATKTAKLNITMHVFIQFLAHHDVLTQWMDATIDRYAPDTIDPDVPTNHADYIDYDITRDNQLESAAVSIRVNNSNPIMHCMSWSQAASTGVRPHRWSALDTRWSALDTRWVTVHDKLNERFKQSQPTNQSEDTT